MYKKVLKFLAGIAGVYLMTACSAPKNVVYLQDIQSGISMMLKEKELIKFDTGDQLRIVVHSRDPEIVRVFNLLENTGSGGDGSRRRSFYTIDEKGNVDMPVLGLIKIAGLTREEAINEIKYKLLELRLVKDPVVTIEYEGLGFYVLGEVSKRGRISITRDRVTLLEAIAEAGDLTIEGKRDNILVLRTTNGKQTPYRVSLLDTETLYSSPVYYIQQNDVIYVEPNLKRSNSSTVNGNNFLTPGFWMSAFSFTMSLILLLLK